jgi:hypothetical protein
VRRWVVGLVLVVFTACGGGGSSGWSKADQQQFLANDLPASVIGTPQEHSAGECLLRVAEQNFGTRAEEVKATGGGLDSSSATEAGKAYINEALDKCNV